MAETLDSENGQESKKKSNGKSHAGLIAFLILISIINIGVGILNSSTIADMSKSIAGMHESIGSTTQKFNELSQNINNNIESQTALLHRTIGDVLPVVVPEKSRAEFDAVKQAVAELKGDMSDENLSAAVDLYTDFIQTTAPWIQQELTSEIMEAKATIDYCSILNTYKNDKDVETVVDSLQTFILSNTAYSGLNDVVAQYDDIVEEQNKLYDKAISDITAQAKAILEKKTASYAELQNLLKDMEPYQDDDAVAEYIPMLYTCMTEAATLEETMNEADSLYRQIQDGDKSLAEEMYAVYANQLAQHLYDANSISMLDNSALMKKLNECMSGLASYEEQIQKNTQHNLAKQIKDSVSSCRRELEKMPFDSMASTTLQIIANQLASLKFSAGNIDESERTAVLSDIDSCVALLKSKEQNLGTSNAEYDEKIKKYNEAALNKIESANKEFQNLSGNKTQKAEWRKELLVNLEKIQTTYLYAPVSMVYQQVYSEIWNELNKDEQLEVSKRAIDISRDQL